MLTDIILVIYVYSAGTLSIQTIDGFDSFDNCLRTQTAIEKSFYPSEHPLVRGFVHVEKPKGTNVKFLCVLKNKL